MNVLLVANPTAQSGKNLARIELAKEFFLSQGAACELFPTRPSGETVAALRARLIECAPTIVVAMGGDGTFREVGEAILSAGVAASLPMGMLPTGTANDQGKSFGLSADPNALEQNVMTVLGGYETRLDAGRLETFAADGALLATSTFFDSAGWGLSAKVLANRNKDREQVAKFGALSELYRDQWVYAGAFLRVFLESFTQDDTFDVRATVDGRTFDLTHVTDLIVKGTRIYAGAWVFDKSSKHDDGLFELVPFRGKADWASKAIVDLEGNPLDEEKLNEVGIEHSKPVQGAEMELQITRGAELFGQIDGEEHPAGHRMRLTVERRALRLIIPRPA